MCVVQKKKKKSVPHLFLMNRLQVCSRREITVLRFLALWLRVTEAEGTDHVID